MNTPSHFLIGAAVARCSRYPVVTSAFLLGSIAPDIPLYLLSIGGWVYYRHFQGLTDRAAFQLMFDEHFFRDPVWIALHNILHSPLVLAIAIAILWSSRRAIGSLQRWGLHFFLSCSIHTALDILTHVNDGPLLLFPLNWSLRFESPISYWDHRYFGREFTVFEIVLDLLLIVLLFILPKLRGWLGTEGGRSAQPATSMLESEASPPSD
ncbi:metal-dependent hydrolase [Synechococcus sp. PCC 7336]|uniref:metal-dependent hydrolase n=1 Tax=Synechococcus sp. PCC 7336 TaxID=195250 RepID=UPI000344AC9B|nr:metal-dependent hydrolase [Synechococcus sp. PCC 7336]